MNARRGFTLIELSIVLVIIGLIIGGILVGQDLVSQAGLRATLAQIEKYNTAANTFVTKFGYLPGDIPTTQAAQFGFVSRTGTAGRGDGNGVIEGWCCGNDYGWNQNGETVFFWEDLSSANLMDGTHRNRQRYALSFQYGICPISARC